MAHPAPGIKEVTVAPLAAGRETLGLLAAIFLIAVFAGLRVAQVAPPSTGAGLEAYQLRDIKLKNQAPALYRSLLGAADSIILLREADGSWPDAAALKQESLPPFAEAFLPAGARGFSWELRQGTAWADYYGVNKNTAAAEKAGADPLENSFILRIIDFQAGAYPYPVADRQEQGQQKNRFAVQVWTNSKTVDYPDGPLNERGWKWIVSGQAALEKKTAD
jgi:hypothetical protein